MGWGGEGSGALTIKGRLIIFLILPKKLAERRISVKPTA